MRVKAVPKSREQRVERLADGSLKAWLRSAPEGGKANAELVEAIAEFFKVKKSCVRVARGAKSRDKIVEIAL